MMMQRSLQMFGRLMGLRRIVGGRLQRLRTVPTTRPLLGGQRSRAATALQFQPNRSTLPATRVSSLRSDRSDRSTADPRADVLLSAPPQHMASMSLGVPLHLIVPKDAPVFVRYHPSRHLLSRVRSIFATHCNHCIHPLTAVDRPRVLILTGCA